MNRPFETEEPAEGEAEPELTDVSLAVAGLLELFHAKLLRAPAAHAARACLVLLDHLDHAYRAPPHALLARLAPCRLKVLRGRSSRVNLHHGHLYDSRQASHDFNYTLAI